MLVDSTINNNIRDKTINFLILDINLPALNTKLLPDSDNIGQP